MPQEGVLYVCSVCRNHYAIRQLVPSESDARFHVAPCRCRPMRMEVYVPEASLQKVQGQAVAGARLQKWLEGQGYWLPPEMQVFKRGEGT